MISGGQLKKNKKQILFKDTEEGKWEDKEKSNALKGESRHLWRQRDCQVHVLELKYERPQLRRGDSGNMWLDTM